MFGNMNDRGPYKFLKGAFFLAAMIGFFLLAATFVMLLWNALLPDLFDWKTIGFFQAVGLLFLTRILFGGFRWHRGNSRWSGKRRGAWRRKWSALSEEEKEIFKAKWREKCK